MHMWAALNWQAWFTLALVCYILAMLALTQLAADVILVSAVTALLVAGVLTPAQAFAGMSNEGMLTVAVLYVVVSGVQATGGTALVVQGVLGHPRSAGGAIAKMTLPVAFVSAWLNNTPVVAMLVPVIHDWAKRLRLPASKLMIPLSYAAVLGGVCTLIGTSTNLVVTGLLKAAGLQGLSMFDLAWVGVPIALAGIGFLVLTQRWLLPEHGPAFAAGGDLREYAVEMVIEPGGPLVGKTIEAAGLRHLPQMFVAEIERDGELLPAVSPSERLRAHDRLTFVGVVDSVADLQKIRGLRPATDQVHKLGAPRPQRCLIEAVVADRCPNVGQTIRDGRFRTTYNAVVIAVARSGTRINRKIGDIVLQAGDNLLLEAHPNFVERERNSQHFHLVSQVANSSPPRHERALLAIAILVGLIVVVSFEWLSMLVAGMVAAGAMIVTGCTRSQLARRSVDWSVLIAIAAALAVGKAVEITGLAAAVAHSFIDLAGGQPWPTLVVVYGVTLLLTELVTNNAAAVLVFPIVLEAARDLNVAPLPFVIALALAASLAFATPLGYQTHMMVYGAGGYRFRDFQRVGVPLDLLCWILAALLIPLVFPFTPAR